MKVMNAFWRFLKMDIWGWAIKSILRSAILRGKAVIAVTDARNSQFITLHGANSRNLEYLLDLALKHDPSVKIKLL